jgi:hypothetical protein
VEVAKLVDEALMAAAAMVIVKSPALMLLAAISIPVAIVSVAVRQCATALLRRSQIVIQFEAEQVGGAEDVAAA